MKPPGQIATAKESIALNLHDRETANAEELARRNVQSLVERNRLDRGVDAAEVVPEAVREVGVIGAGLMGAAIAAAHVKQGVPVAITDTDPAALAAAADRIAGELVTNPPEGEPAEDDARRAVARLVTTTTDAARIGACDLVIESVAETVPAKHAVYAGLEPHFRAGTILASNTSTIPIGRLAAGLAAPERFVGLHFFHPVRHRPLVEIVRGPQTSGATVAAAVAHAKRIDKMPIVVDDGPGFLVNRLLVPYLTEALELLLDGASIDAVEQAATGFGMAMGPLRLVDEIGIDTVMQGGRVLWEAFPERVVASPLLVSMVKAGRLGCKTGAGFFLYPNGPRGAGEFDPAVNRMIAKWAHKPQPLDAETIADRLLLPMVLEATRLLEEHHVRDARDVDLAVLFGLGFPAQRGGLLYWADALGADQIVARLRRLAPLGPRAEPTGMLLEVARRGSRFYNT
jgi:3-hydroxyacyl-CoA dehydrogenase/enoyl-CoA hydratase/3-hydroxybutyryl-CoA epimerase/3-hydroxyacyl-CoA dehydrogenase/enoyl-CoA hydratase/3-hydroxybutyryl-CoA epimerase/enoyl-CoA isomerase